MFEVEIQTAINRLFCQERWVALVCRRYQRRVEFEWVALQGMVLDLLSDRRLMLSITKLGNDLCPRAFGAFFLWDCIVRALKGCLGAEPAWLAWSYTSNASYFAPVTCIACSFRGRTTSHSCARSVEIMIAAVLSEATQRRVSMKCESN